MLTSESRNQMPLLQNILTKYALSISQDVMDAPKNDAKVLDNNAVPMNGTISSHNPTNSNSICE